MRYYRCGNPIRPTTRISDPTWPRIPDRTTWPTPIGCGAKIRYFDGGDDWTRCPNCGRPAGIIDEKGLWAGDPPEFFENSDRVWYRTISRSSTADPRPPTEYRMTAAWRGSPGR